jgi:hypothetical protein
MPYAVAVARLRAELADGRRDAFLRGVDADPQLEALRSRLAGDLAGRASDALHGLERTCAALGRLLPNGSVAPVRLEALDAVDAALPPAVVEAGFDLGRLWSRGPPLDLPRAVDYPLVGYVDEAAVARAWTIVRDDPLEADEPDVDSVLAEVQDWLELAATADAGIVAFY